MRYIFKRFSRVCVDIEEKRSLFVFLNLTLFWFLERGKGREKRGRETLMGERNISWLPSICTLTGTKPTIQAHALTGNRTGDLSVCRTMPSQLNHTNEGKSLFKWESHKEMFSIRNKYQIFRGLFRTKHSCWEGIGDEIEKCGWVLVYEGFNSQAELLHIRRVEWQMKEVIDKFGHGIPSELEEGKSGVKETS